MNMITFMINQNNYILLHFTEIKLHSYPIMDADLVMYVNGEFYSKQKDIETDKGYIWEYTFTMPVDKATLEFKAEGGI